MTVVTTEEETYTTDEGLEVTVQAEVCLYRTQGDPNCRCKRCMPRRKKKPRWKTESYSARLRNRWDYYGGKCWLCGDEANTWDHVKPQSKGGSRYLPGNLRPACAPCNNAKGNLWPVPEFMVIVDWSRETPETPDELAISQRDKLRRQAHSIAKLMMEVESLKVKGTILKEKIDAMVEHDHCEYRVEVLKQNKKIEYYENERLKNRVLP